MEIPTDSENIQLVAVLRVLRLSLDAVASILHLGKSTIVETEKWIKTEDLQAVRDILDDKVLKATVQRDLVSLEEVDRNILVRALQVDRATILVHYGREISEEDSEEELKRHKEDLAQAAREVLRRLYTYIPWDEGITIEDINLEKDDTEAIGFFTDKIIIGLFAHLQNDMPTLQKCKMWEELKVKDITTQLLDEISLKAANRDFHGKCEVCKENDC